MYKAVDVYLEKRGARHYVGRLRKSNRNFVFEYSEAYQYSDNPLPVGPDLPINKKTHSSLKLFPSFEDRIPLKQNPAYKEYCQSVGISPFEKNPFVLLAKLGRKGPSSFIITPVLDSPQFSKEDLRRFRKELNLSLREFAELFDISTASLYRIENDKTSGKQILKKVSDYYKFPKAALEKLKYTGHKINDQKRQYVTGFFTRRLLKKEIKSFPGLITVKSEDISKCSPQQAIELIRYLLKSECSNYGILQNSIQISDNISAPDGGQDGLVEWREKPPHTDYFPARYNCFQVKTKAISPSECRKEILDKNNRLNPAIKNVLQNKGAYILCSTQEVAGININKRESAIKEAIQEKGGSPDQIAVKFYDAGRIADWINCFPNVAKWFLKEICNRSISPWVSWIEWSRTCSDYQSEFMIHSELDKKRNFIRSVLLKPKGVIHLTGAGGTGKTRLAMETFRPIYKELKYSNKTDDNLIQEEDLSHLVLYSSANDLKKFHFRELKLSRLILIIDDCSLEEAESFHKIALQEDSKLSLLTIGHEEKVEGTFRNIWKQSNEVKKQIIKLVPDEEIVKKILSGSQNISSKYIEPKYLQLTQGFPIMAELIKKIEPSILLKDDMPTIKKKMLWGQERPDIEGEKVIKACSLFDTICFSDPDRANAFNNRGEEEAKHIAQEICKMDYDIFYEKIQFFKERKIIQQYGRFIQVRPKPLAVWLAAEKIKDTPTESIKKWFSEMKVSSKPDEASPEDHKLEQKLYADLSDTDKKEFNKWRTDQLILHGLRESFCKQIAYLGLSLEAEGLAEELCGENGFFGKEETLSTQWDLRCFSYLAELNPSTALQTLNRIFSGKTTEELKNFFPAQESLVAGQLQFPSELIWTLEKLAVTKKFYPKAAGLLLQFAELEENSNCKPATDVFTHHFQIYLSGTEALPDMKFQIIQEIQQSQSVKKKEIALQALGTALKPEEIRSRSSEIMQTQSGKIYEDWQPETLKEQQNYFRKALNYFVDFATKDKNREIQKKACNYIATNLNSLLRQGLYDDAEKAIKAVITVHGTHWPLAVNELLLFLKYQSDKIKSEHIQRIRNMIDLVQPQKDINERLRFYISECSWNYLYDEMAEKKNPEYTKKFEQLLKDFTNYLENESEEKTESSLKKLFHGEQRNTIEFAYKSVKLLNHPLRLADQLLTLIKKWKNDINFNPSFFCGFVRGLNESFQKETQHILNKIAESTALADFTLQAHFSLKLQDQDIKRLINVIDKTKFKSNELRTLVMGKKCQSVSPEVMSQLIRILIKKGGEFLWDALNIYILYVYNEVPEKKEKLLPVLFELLIQDKLLLNKKKYNSRDAYCYEKAVNDLLNSDYGKDFSEKFVSQIINAKISFLNFSIDFETIKKCFTKILKKYPDKVLSEIINNIDNYKIQFLFKHSASFRQISFKQHSISPLSILTEGQLKEWCTEAPDKIPVFLARNMNLFLPNKDKGYWSWSPSVRFLLDKYGDKEALTDAISMNLAQFSWTGNLSDYFERIKKPIEELTTHKHKNVREFAEHQILLLDKDIKTQKHKEKELEEFGIW